MKKKLRTISSTLALLGVMTFGLVQPAHAAVPVFNACNGNADTAICKSTGDKLFGPNSVWSRILNTLIFVTGSVSVLMIVIGGLRYTISGGDQGNINAAKNTILYAVVGLVLSLMGYAIVNFVLSRI